MGIGPSKEEQEILDSINTEEEQLKKDIELADSLNDIPSLEVKGQGSVNEQSMEKLLNNFNQATIEQGQLNALKPIIEKTFLELINHSDILAKYVYLSTTENTHFSDNYFDVLPNKVYKVTLSKPSEEINIKSLFDTMD